MEISEAIEVLRPFLPKVPAQIVDDIQIMKKYASDNKLLYADYGDSIMIKGVGRFLQKWEGSPYSAGQIAKAYLKFQEWNWPLFRRAKLAQEIKPALYFRGPIEGDWVYVDLAHAYWSIGKRLPWHTLGPFGGPLRGAQGYFERPELIDGIRRSRLVLFGLLAFPGSSTLWVYPDGTMKTAECPTEMSRFGNRIWSASILLVVNAFAQDLMATFPDAPLFMTDGAILPISQAEASQTWALEKWKLDIRPKEHGSGLVAAPGVYQWRPSFRPIAFRRERASMPSLDIQKIRSWWLKEVSKYGKRLQSGISSQDRESGEPSGIDRRAGEDSARVC